MEIALIAPGRDLAQWSKLFKAKAGLNVQVWPDIRYPDRVELAIVWKPPDGVFGQFKNLKLISSLGAGVDDIVKQSQLPDVPIVRIIDPKLTQDMSNYLVMQVLNFHHETWKYRSYQKVHYWDLQKQPRSVWNAGILGWGVLGKSLGKKLETIGFKIHVLSSRPVNSTGNNHHTMAQLDKFMGAVDILINLLPLTKDTMKILNMQTFLHAKKPFYLINAARGGHLVEDDLIAALDDGLIEGACLDVFSKEPLPIDHPFWDHPGIIITPHIAGITNPETAIDQILENLYRARQGEPVINQINSIAGY